MGGPHSTPGASSAPVEAGPNLFDIDLRLRWTVKQSTLAAIVMAVFYVISEGADRLPFG